MKKHGLKHLITLCNYFRCALFFLNRNIEAEQLLLVNNKGLANLKFIKHTFGNYLKQVAVTI